jgi:hypothetical protein
VAGGGKGSGEDGADATRADDPHPKAVGHCRT